MLDLKIARDRLDKARRKHETEKEVYVQKAKELLKAKKKDQAKLALRMKKLRDVQAFFAVDGWNRGNGGRMISWL